MVMGNWYTIFWEEHSGKVTGEVQRNKTGTNIQTNMCETGSITPK